MTGELSKNFHGVGIGPLSNILAVMNFDEMLSTLYILDEKLNELSNFDSDLILYFGTICSR